MSLKENLEKAIIDSLRRDNLAIQKYEEHFKEINEYLKKFSETAIKEYQEQGLPEVVIEAIRESAMQKQEKIRKVVGENKLGIEIVRNRGELYLPVRWKNGTSLETEIVSYICAVTTNPSIGTIGEYVAIAGRVNKKTLQAGSDNLKSANIDLSMCEVTMPIKALYEAQKELRVKLTPSAIDYNLIPVRKGDNAPEFFPDYKEPFHIVTPTGKIQCWVTSETRYAPRSGNYIMGCDGAGSLKEIMEEMKLTAEDTLIVKELKPKKLYSIRKA